MRQQSGEKRAVPKERMFEFKTMPQIKRDIQTLYTKMRISWEPFLRTLDRSFWARVVFFCGLVKVCSIINNDLALA
jgi:hypothetical protein